MFSSRLPASLAVNRITRVVADARARGVRLLDLTETNPTVVGLEYPGDLLSPLGTANARRYDPQPLGLVAAREAVAAEFERRGTPVPSSNIVLAASTSDAYAMLFKLLCDPGDEVLVPQPSYPLFEWLTRLDAVGSRPYRLDWDGRWSIDLESVERACTPRTRAIVVVSPNNPTGSIVTQADSDWIAAFAERRRLAIVADEVFADYPMMPGPDGRAMAGTGNALTFSLGGLSKSAGLPQVKLGWIGVSGPAEDVRAAMARLELIADTYLAVSTPVQAAAVDLIRGGACVRRLIANRLHENLRALAHAAAEVPEVTLRPPEGGWSAVLQVPATQSEEDLVCGLVEDAHTLVHPGHFFDFDREAFLVVSLLPEPSVFAEGVGRVFARVREWGG